MNRRSFLLGIFAAAAAIAVPFKKASNQFGVWGTRKSVQGYTGPLAMFRNAAGETRDFFPNALGEVDCDALRLFLGDQPGTMCTLYDQAGDQDATAHHPIPLKVPGGASVARVGRDPNPFLEFEA